MKKRIICILVVVILAMAVGVIIYSAPANRLTRQLNFGQKYMAELDYEQAVIAYTRAIEIDPMNVDAYLGLAEAYESMDNVDLALAMLEKGYELTADVRLQTQLQKERELIHNEAVAEEISVEEISADSESDIPESDVSETETAAEFTVEEAYEAYNMVMDEYRETCAIGVQDWFDNRSKYVKQYPNVSPLLMDEYHTPSHYNEETGDEPFEIACSYVDIDNNGIPELIIEEGYHELIMREIFVYNGTMAVPLNVRSDEKYDSYGIFTNGVIAVYGANKYYRLGSDGYTLQQIFLLENDLRDLYEYLIDDFIILGKDIEADEPVDDDLAQNSNLIGLWVNQEWKSMAEWAECTLYTDGTVGVAEHNSFFGGTYVVESDGSVSLYLNDGFFYNNADVSWYEEAVECRINLTMGENSQRINFSLIYDTYESQVCIPELVLTKLYNDDDDYVSVMPKIQEYREKVLQSQAN